MNNTDRKGYSHLMKDGTGRWDVILVEGPVGRETAIVLGKVERWDGGKWRGILFGKGPEIIRDTRAEAAKAVAAA